MSTLIHQRSQQRGICRCSNARVDEGVRSRIAGCDEGRVGDDALANVTAVALDHLREDTVTGILQCGIDAGSDPEHLGHGFAHRDDRADDAEAFGDPGDVSL